MLLFGNKIEKLTKFIIKVLKKAIKAGNKIILLYENAAGEITVFRTIIKKLEDIIGEIQSESVICEKTADEKIPENEDDLV